MKKRTLLSAFFAFALIFSFGTEVSVLAAPDLFSPLGASRPPTIPILPPID